MEADREKWKKIAGDNKAIGEVAPGSKAGQERAVATAREMDALKSEISSLQAAVRYLREDNRRMRFTEPQSNDWLHTPLIAPKTRIEQRQDLVLAEGQDVLNELLNLTTSAKIYDLSTMPNNRLTWRPAKSTPQYHVAKQREDYEAWSSWREAVTKKGQALIPRDEARIAERRKRTVAATVELRLPELYGKEVRGGEVEIVEPGEFENFRTQLGFV